MKFVTLLIELGNLQNINTMSNLKRSIVWISVLFIFGLLIFGCEPDQYEQIEPTVCADRDTGYIVVFNRWARLPDDTIAVERHRGIFNEVSCQGEKRERILLPITAPILKYWADPTACTKFEHCN